MTPENEQALLDAMARHLPREARWAYWQDGRGPMFIYNTERIHTRDPSDPADGMFESAVSVPYGRGSRSGKATRWKIVEKSRSLHDQRKSAKQRAYRLYQHWRETGEIDV